MPRLRITASLSLLALIVGTAGTGWLSAQTEGWRATSSSAAAPLAHTPRWTSAARTPNTLHRPVRAWVVRAPRVARATEHAPMTPVDTPSAPTLVPVSMPADATPYDRLRGHLDGRVVLRLTVDGLGRVRQATVAQSSGDPVLDAHALSVADGWRFAVPDDRPDGFSGELPMRFASEPRLARTP